MSKLTKLAWIFIVLMVISSTLFAQGWKNGNRSFKSRNNNCVNQISGLSDEQKAKIEGLKETHLAKMAELRKQRQSTTDVIEKSEIRTTMLKNVKTHGDEVKSLLTTEQQKDYDLLQARRNYGNGWRNANFQGRCHARGQQFTGSHGCGASGNRGGGGPGYGRGNR